MGVGVTGADQQGHRRVAQGDDDDGHRAQDAEAVALSADIRFRSIQNVHTYKTCLCDNKLCENMTFLVTHDLIS